MRYPPTALPLAHYILGLRRTEATTKCARGTLLLPPTRLVWLQLPRFAGEVNALLKLKRVELQGFKSFCERTELRFNGEGIAAIVGPERLRQVEHQRRHQLGAGRAVGQEPPRHPHGRCDLRRHARPQTARHGLRHHDAGRSRSLPGRRRPHKIQAVDEPQPKRPGEITITRRLYRSGESEYLIDGRTARLRDIQDLFMGTGLGPESYAIIEQGRIGQILSSKPQDRRAVIEEAAGITKFKTRKRLAEAKLESAKQNLARVYDILEEVTRQVNSLKRQASKAKRYDELKAELEDAPARRAFRQISACWSAMPRRPPSS